MKFIKKISKIGLYLDEKIDCNFKISKKYFFSETLNFVEEKYHNGRTLEMLEGDFLNILRKFNFENHFIISIKKAFQDNLDDTIINLEVLLMELNTKFEELSYKEKLNKFNRFNNEDKKIVLKEIIERSSVEENALKRILENLDYIEKTKENLDYLMDIFINVKRLKHLEYRDLNNFNNSFDEKIIDSIDNLKRESYNDVLKDRLALTKKEFKRIENFKI